MEILVSTNNTTIIKSVIIFAEGIFKGETHIVHPSPSKLKNEMVIPLIIPRDLPVDIHIKVSIPTSKKNIKKLYYLYNKVQSMHVNKR